MIDQAIVVVNGGGITGRNILKFRTPETEYALLNYRLKRQNKAENLHLF
jgi:hypothetical protein